MSASVTIYHNPRCSKSRQTLQLLEEQGITPEVRLYLTEVPSQDELKDVLAKLGISARELLRTKEQEYKDLELKDTNKTEEDILAAMIAHPKLIERPIVVKGEQARIGRPPEQVLEIL
ncbi:arsenate reductase (glutaredoxin) [Litoribrevibacter albus]|uniref:Arsenate reductase n=1 Tax=Litoribrevibacter albus TaxID=1473156 RepID=A0AA37W7D4_9GAMM|nr:arsenate reductase (glutaredoxin) [Litoribrevibacter albus]GLQ31258.1 arsenate reductase [Litoribrevibacter albus]